MSHMLSDGVKIDPVATLNRPGMLSDELLNILENYLEFLEGLVRFCHPPIREEINYNLRSVGHYPPSYPFNEHSIADMTPSRYVDPIKDKMSCCRYIIEIMHKRYSRFSLEYIFPFRFVSGTIPDQYKAFYELLCIITVPDHIKDELKPTLIKLNLAQ